jgi:hypothetical protein
LGFFKKGCKDGGSENTFRDKAPNNPGKVTTAKGFSG